jgi:acetyltransferase-like isoleucine patch superfamily enzyme
MIQSHGTGLPPWEFRFLGEGTVIEHGVLVFHPENIFLGENVYIGHLAILKGYYRNEMRIGNGTWIGQQCFLHAAGGIEIGKEVGIGPGVKMLTSVHDLELGQDQPIMRRAINLAPIRIGDGCDLGVNAVILPGVNLGLRVQVGAGAVVTRSFPDDSVIAGVPARLLRRTQTITKESP